MKITIELNEAQVKGIKDYLKEVGDIDSPKKEDIATEIRGIIDTSLQAQHSSLADYINKYLNEDNRGLGLSDHSNVSDSGYEDY